MHPSKSRLWNTYLLPTQEALPVTQRELRRSPLETSDVEDNRHTTKHPLVGDLFRAKLCEEHKVGAPRRHCVRGAIVNVFIDLVVGEASLATNNWQLHEHFLWPGIIHARTNGVPPRTFEKHASHEGALLRHIGYLLHLSFGHVRVHQQLVKLQPLKLAAQLLDGSQETLRIEEHGQVNNLGNVHGVIDPLVKLHTPFLQIGTPRLQRPRRWET
mmetsp:Transcript_4918/g.13643  ORF Transcript_4918/g.13643 Transcript_4918/m.13643 type:complete len:214 (-) Transcript_4918:607-1248(-)